MFLGDKGRPARKAENLTAICESIVFKMWEPRRLTAVWASTACYRDSFTLRHALNMQLYGRELQCAPQDHAYSSFVLIVC
jgi:hypothetical protein